MTAFKKLCYVACWSIGLLFASFPKLGNGSSDSIFNFEGKLTIEICEAYMFPLLMAFALYLVDVIYIFTQETGRQKHVVGVLSMFLIFLLAFVISISAQDVTTTKICFFVSWAALTYMKFLKTDYNSQSHAQWLAAKVTEN